MQPFAAAAGLLVAYLFGSFSFALHFVRWRTGQDLRSLHSGNLGATNASRVLGRKFGVLIYVLDMLKGLLPVLFARFVLNDPSIGPVPLSLAMGCAAFAGHCWPVWYGFAGGKGVATASGVVLGLHPFTALVALAVFVIVVASVRIMSVASMAAAVALPIAYSFSRRSEVFDSSASAILMVFFLLLMAMVLLRHRSNLVRLVRGEEPRVGRRTP